MDHPDFRKIAVFCIRDCLVNPTDQVPFFSVHKQVFVKHAGKKERFSPDEQICAGGEHLFGNKMILPVLDLVRCSLPQGTTVIVVEREARGSVAVQQLPAEEHQLRIFLKFLICLPENWLDVDDIRVHKAENFSGCSLGPDVIPGPETSVVRGYIPNSRKGGFLNKGLNPFLFRAVVHHDRLKIRSNIVKLMQRIEAVLQHLPVPVSNNDDRYFHFDPSAFFLPWHKYR